MWRDFFDFSFHSSLNLTCNCFCTHNFIGLQNKNRSVESPLSIVFGQCVNDVRLWFSDGESEVLLRLLLSILCIPLDNRTVSAIKRQIPFLIVGTITGVIMTYFWGFAVTLIVNSIMWYLISLIVYKLVWKKNGLKDQMVILKYVLTKTKRQKNMQWT